MKKFIHGGPFVSFLRINTNLNKHSCGMLGTRLFNTNQDKPP